MQTNVSTTAQIQLLDLIAVGIQPTISIVGGLSGNDQAYEYVRAFILPRLKPWAIAQSAMQDECEHDSSDLIAESIRGWDPAHDFNRGRTARGNEQTCEYVRSFISPTVKTVGY